MTRRMRDTISTVKTDYMKTIVYSLRVRTNTKRRKQEANEDTCCVTRALESMALQWCSHVNRVDETRMLETIIKSAGSKKMRRTSIDFQKYVQIAVENRDLQDGG